MKRYALFLAIAFALTACGNPLDRVKTLESVELSKDAEPLNISASAMASERKGFFAKLLSKSDSEKDAVSVDVSTLGEQGVDEEALLQVPEARSGFFAFLRPKADQPEPLEDDFADGEVIAADDIEDDASVPSAKRSLFGFLSRKPAEEEAALPATGPASQLVSTGTLLPYGEIGTNCEVSPQELGTRVANASGYGLFDTGGDTKAARSFYLTGFPDACVRQFTAAMVMFGDVGTYEVLRYKTGRKASSATDKAYDLIQSQFCGVSVGEPCGAQLDELSKSTTFLTAYESFGTNGHWADILIHDGRVVSVELREP